MRWRLGFFPVCKSRTSIHLPAICFLQSPMRESVLSMQPGIISPSPSVEGATPDDSANEHGLQLVLARPCVQKAIEEGGSYTPLDGVDGLPQDLIKLLQAQFAIVMNHPHIKGSMEQQTISRYRIGKTVSTVLSRGSLSREDVKTILTHNVIRAFRTSGCEITTPENRSVKDLTGPLRRSRRSLGDWFEGVTNYAHKQRAIGDPDVGDTPGDGLDGSFNVAAYNEYLTRGIDPREPTKTRGGSEGKVRMLEARYAAGLPLWHDKDGPTDNEDPPGVARRRPSLFLAPSASDDDDDASDDDTDDIGEDSDQDDAVAGVDVVEEE